MDDGGLTPKKKHTYLAICIEIKIECTRLLVLYLLSQPIHLRLNLQFYSRRRVLDATDGGARTNTLQEQRLHRV